MLTLCPSLHHMASSSSLNNLIVAVWLFTALDGCWYVCLDRANGIARHAVSDATIY